MRLAVVSLFVSSFLASAQEGDVQAFVRGLTPLNQTLPALQGVSGKVELLVTIDSLGNVTAVEALTGPQGLRKIAADLVQEWRYRSVLRDGHGVSAYTTASVTFIASGKRIALDQGEEQAAVKRMIELEKKYPRTPAMALADLEQDSSGLTKQQRFYALAKLAKAAWAAGAVDKAGSYANELVDSAGSYPKDWNAGNAVHDGNSILGLVALSIGNLTQAGKYLLEAGRTPGSPQLMSFGPNVTLAKALLEKGQRDVVLEYFGECRKFWKMGTSQLDAWTLAVEDGQVPNFGANLVY